MKPTMQLLLPLLTAMGLSVLQPCSALAQASGSSPEGANNSSAGSSATTESDASASKPLPTDPVERFKALLTKANLSGRWASLRDGELGEERSGDTYHIVSVTQGEGDNWIVNARMKYGDQTFVLPIPVQVKFAGDAAILIVDKMAVPNGGTYSAHVMFYERTYSGMWMGARGGGMLYGTVSNETE